MQHSHVVDGHGMKRDGQRRTTFLPLLLRKLGIVLDPSCEFPHEVLFERHRMECFQLLVVARIHHEHADTRQTVGQIDILSDIVLARLSFFGFSENLPPRIASTPAD